jgi:hypothetical protein
MTLTSRGALGAARATAARSPYRWVALFLLVLMCVGVCVRGTSALLWRGVPFQGDPPGWRVGAWLSPGAACWQMSDAPGPGEIRTLHLVVSEVWGARERLVALPPPPNQRGVDFPYSDIAYSQCDARLYLLAYGGGSSRGVDGASCVLRLDPATGTCGLIEPPPEGATGWAQSLVVSAGRGRPFLRCTDDGDGDYTTQNHDAARAAYVPLLPRPGETPYRDPMSGPDWVRATGLFETEESLVTCDPEVGIIEITRATGEMRYPLLSEPGLPSIPRLVRSRMQERYPNRVLDALFASREELVCFDTRGQAMRWNWRSGAVEWSHAISAAQPTGVSLSPDGNAVLYWPRQEYVKALHRGKRLSPRVEALRWGAAPLP